jgi:hypothetical protein
VAIADTAFYTELPIIFPNLEELDYASPAVEFIHPFRSLHKLEIMPAACKSESRTVYSLSAFRCLYRALEKSFIFPKLRQLTLTGNKVVLERTKELEFEAACRERHILLDTRLWPRDDPVVDDDDS